jgi:hypothetical protein
MTSIIVELPDDLAAQIDPTALPAMLRELVERKSAKPASNGEDSHRPTPIYREITEFLSSSPAADQIIAFKITSAAQHRLEDLLYKNREEFLDPEERAELDTYLQLSEWISILKARAWNGRPLLG